MHNTHSQKEIFYLDLLKVIDLHALIMYSNSLEVYVIMFVYLNQNNQQK